MENILDDGDNRSISDLSLFQLTGIIHSAVRYPQHYIETAKAELNKRNPEQSELEVLEKNFFKEIKLDSGTTFRFNKKLLFLIIMLSFSLFISFPLLVLSSLVIFASLLAIEIRYKKGKRSETKFWKSISIFLALLFSVVLILGFVTN